MGKKILPKLCYQPRDLQGSYDQTMISDLILTCRPPSTSSTLSTNPSHRKRPVQELTSTLHPSYEQHQHRKTQQPPQSQPAIQEAHPIQKATTQHHQGQQAQHNLPSTPPIHILRIIDKPHSVPTLPTPRPAEASTSPSETAKEDAEAVRSVNDFKAICRTAHSISCGRRPKPLTALRT
jgi:hypothetical protein